MFLLSEKDPNHVVERSGVTRAKCVPILSSPLEDCTFEVSFSENAKARVSAVTAPPAAISLQCESCVLGLALSF